MLAKVDIAATRPAANPIILILYLLILVFRELDTYVDRLNL